MYFVQASLFIFGLLIGSFLNAIIYRLPRDLSMLTRSQCPKCNNTISWFDNIPLLSYVFLKGKCRHCHIKIPIHYPMIELLTGLISLSFAYSLLQSNGLMTYSFYFSIACVFICHFVIDLQHKILPNELNIYLLILFIFYSLFFYPWQYWVLGGAIGLLFPLGVTMMFYYLRGKVGLGGGDIKLYGILGIYLGPIGISQTIFLSCFLGAIIGVLLIATRRIAKDQPLSFGPFILVIATWQIFFSHSFQKFSQKLLLFYLPS